MINSRGRGGSENSHIISIGESLSGVYIHNVPSSGYPHEYDEAIPDFKHMGKDCLLMLDFLKAIPRTTPGQNSLYKMIYREKRRFRGKSFFKFLFSGGKDTDKFR